MMVLRQKKLPTRKCVGCQAMFDKRDMVRVVLTPEGTVQLDLTGKRNGRGAYLCRNADCLRVAKKRKALDRALKVAVSDALYDELTLHLEEVVRHGSTTHG